MPKLNGRSISPVMSADRQFLVGVMSPKVRRMLLSGDCGSIPRLFNGEKLAEGGDCNMLPLNIWWVGGGGGG